MSGPSTDRVTIVLPVGQGAPVPSETVAADPLDLPTGLYRVAGMTLMADGVGRGDVVRCAVAGDHRLVATDVVARTDRTTLALTCVEATDRTDAEQQAERLATFLTERFADRGLIAEVTTGMCAVHFPEELDEALAAAILEHGGSDAQHDPGTQRLGPYGYVMVSAPELPVPLHLAGAEQLLDVEVEVVAPDWEGDDEVARGWDEGVRRVLRDQAATNAALRQLLDERCYLAAIAPILRQMLLHRFPAEEVGAAPFALHPPADDEDAQRLRAAWNAARGAEGTVRWCVGDRADATLRTMIASFGLDPDADPWTPVV